jgi:hypothetical protein
MRRCEGDSDYEEAVFLDGLELFRSDLDRPADIETDILYDTGAVINALAFAARQPTRSRPAS